MNRYPHRPADRGPVGATTALADRLAAIRLDLADLTTDLLLHARMGTVSAPAARPLLAGRATEHVNRAIAELVALEQHIRNEAARLERRTKGINLR